VTPGARGLTTISTVLYAVGGLPLRRLADTWSRRGLLAIGVTVWAGLTGMGGLAASYAMLLATRLGVGIGEAMCAPAATRARPLCFHQPPAATERRYGAGMATPSAAAAFFRSASSVARGKPSRCANSRYAAS